MKTLIYSRKSLFTGKGDSVENQIQLCLEYAASHFGAKPEDCHVFEDEGFSAKDMDRPQFQAMLRAARSGKYDCLICYRLDRVSRSVSDFSAFIQELEGLGVAFVSIREQFDTSTPMGRAMMYIASVFAQLERETLAERVRDNLYQLAKAGRWLGGVTPLGYRSEQVSYAEKGRQRTQRALAPVEDELRVVRSIYEQFLALGSLSRLDAYCLQNGLKSRNGNPFTRFSLRAILENPVYAAADQAVYAWLVDKGYEVYMPQAAFDGTRGVLAYCKTVQKKHTANKKRAPGEWIVSIGAHSGLLPGERWIQAQEIIGLNKGRSPRAPRSTDALLSGILRCGCGSFMRPKSGRMLADGSKPFSYCCELKERSKQASCCQKNAPGLQTDAAVVAALEHIASDACDLYARLNKNVRVAESLCADLCYRMEECEAIIREETGELQNIARAMAKNSDESMDRILLSSSRAHTRRLQAARQELEELTARPGADSGCPEQLFTLADALKTISAGFDQMESPIKRAFLRSVIGQALWDGETVTLHIREGAP